MPNAQLPINNENDVAANITPPPKPSIIPCIRVVILIGSNIGKAPTTVASPDAKLAIAPIIRLFIFEKGYLRKTNHNRYEFVFSISNS